MIHFYAPPGDFPDTLCGLSPGWGRYDAVYGRDVHEVDCPKCLAKLQMPPIDLYLPERVHRERDLVYGMCWMIVGSFLFLIGLWWLT